MRIEDVRSVEELDAVAQTLEKDRNQLKYRLRYIDKRLTEASIELAQIQAEHPKAEVGKALKILITAMATCLAGWDEDS